MEDQVLNMEADGMIPEGEYQSVKVNGNATNSGFVCANTIEIKGSATLKETVEAASITIDGDLSLTGIIRTEELIIRGNAEILGKIEAETIVIDGNCEIKDEVTAKTITIKGSAHIESVLTAEELKIELLLTGKDTIKASHMEVVGRIEFDGTIESEVFIAKAFHRGYVKTVKAGQIELMHPFFLMHPTSLFYRDIFTIDQVECNRIYAESIGISSIKAEDIELSKRCIVEDAEYLNSLTATENCRILNAEKIEEL
ncbi:MAG: polymer-forming cytoskeletal protein [bacterium]|nr:polymer-forming cytoskeletal protein [bacterium]